MDHDDIHVSGFIPTLKRVYARARLAAPGAEVITFRPLAMFSVK